MGRNEQIILEILAEVLGRFVAGQLLSGDPVTDEQIAAAKAERKAAVAELRDAIADAKAKKPQ